MLLLGYLQGLRTASGVFPYDLLTRGSSPGPRYNLALHTCHVGLHILNSDAAYGVIGLHCVVM